VTWKPPGPVRGKAELDANFGDMRDAMDQIEVLAYVLDFEEVEIAGDYAFEWGEIRGSVRTKGGREDRAKPREEEVLRA
jgi:hypothetical protein